MFGLTFTALKYLALGMVLGLLLAPRRGVESRCIVMDQGMAAVKGVFSSVGTRRSDEARWGE